MTIENQDIIQFIKYALAGGLATCTHILLFHVVAWKMLPALGPKDTFVRLFKFDIQEIGEEKRAKNSMYGNIIAFMFANMVAYILNILWVFEAGKYSIVIEILVFYGATGLSTFLGTVLMGVLIKRFGILTTYAFGSNIFTAVLFNYVVRKFFIFNG
jgi:putative flippase GtrA